MSLFPLSLPAHLCKLCDSADPFKALFCVRRDSVSSGGLVNLPPLQSPERACGAQSGFVCINVHHPQGSRWWTVNLDKETRA